MKRIFKVSAALLALIGTFLMFGAQAVVKLFTNKMMTVGIEALVGGKYNFGSAELSGDVTNPVNSGLAGYILLGVAALLLFIVALVPYFKEHDMLSMVITGLAVVCLIVGIILIFLIRKNFADNNFVNNTVYVGWGAIAAGSLGGLAILSAGLGMIMDLSGN